MRSHFTNTPVTRLWLPSLLWALLAAQSTISAQTIPEPSQSLNVIALAGDGETNDIERRIMAPLVVQVLDQQARPIEGADVTFRFPVGGASAMFSNQRTSLTVRTNADGQAAATGWTANGQVGRFRVSVTASRGNEAGEVAIHMTNATTIAVQKNGQKRSPVNSGQR